MILRTWKQLLGASPGFREGRGSHCRSEVPPGGFRRSEPRFGSRGLGTARAVITRMSPDPAGSLPDHSCSLCEVIVGPCLCPALYTLQHQHDLIAVLRGQRRERSFQVRRVAQRGFCMPCHGIKALDDDGEGSRGFGPGGLRKCVHECSCRFFWAAGTAALHCGLRPDALRSSPHNAKLPQKFPLGNEPGCCRDPIPGTCVGSRAAPCANEIPPGEVMRIGVTSAPPSGSSGVERTPGEVVVRASGWVIEMRSPTPSSLFFRSVGSGVRSGRSWPRARHRTAVPAASRPPATHDFA